MKYVDPYTDFGFKKLFGTEANKELLRDFLNELIRDKGRIKYLRYLPGEQLGMNATGRKSVFDIYCETDRKEKFIVEMQQTTQRYFKDRSVYYSSFPILEQGRKGNQNWNFKLKAVYFVGILDFKFDKNIRYSDYYHHEVKLMDMKTHRVFFDKMTFIYLEMPKFKKSESELETNFDKWMYVLKNLSRLETRPTILNESVFDRLFETAELAKFTEAELMDYECSLKVYRDNYSIMETKRYEGRKEGRKEGRIEGEAIGLEKGRKEGLEKGRREGLEETVLTGYRNGMSIEQIEIFSRLSSKEILEIINNNYEL